MLFKIVNKKVLPIDESHFELEKDIQTLIENNIEDIFPDLGLTFLKFQYSANGFFFDSLAFDKENKIFYILEYKNVEKRCLVDQGVAYLKTLLDRKAEFTYFLEESKNIVLKPNDIDWESTRVLFIAPSFNNYQLEIAKLNNAPFSLYKFSKYGKDMFSIEKIEYKNKDKTNFRDLNIGIDSQEIKSEIKVYTEEDHLKDKEQKIKDLYENIKSAILDVDSSINLECKKKYIAFKGTKRNICDVEIYKSNIKVFINVSAGNLDDPFKISKIMKKDD